MGKMAIDETLRAKLSEAKEEVEFLDENGQPVGFFFPSELCLKMMYAWARAEFASDEDLKEAKKESGGLSTAEVLRQLKEIEQQRKNP